MMGSERFDSGPVRMGGTLVQQRIADYQLCLKVANGGMATVYLARTRVAMGRHGFVALKVLHPHLTGDEQFVEMFRDEVEIASRIRHVNVCNVIDYGAADGAHYLAMEYLVGETLRTMWRKLSRLSDPDPGQLVACVSRVLSGACEGLHAAHELTDSEDELLHVVHRDVSPENLFLTYDGVAKLVDFGVASAIRKRHHTKSGIVKGKYSYLAPEVLRGQRVDRRADVWGIGVIAWEMLTGKRLFHRDTDVETLRAVGDLSIPPPSKVRPGLSPEIDAIVMRALSRQLDRRYPTARDLGNDLAQQAIRGGHVVTESELGEWLDHLVPGGRARHEQAIRLVTARDFEPERFHDSRANLNETPREPTRLAVLPAQLTPTQGPRRNRELAVRGVALAAAAAVGFLVGAYLPRQETAAPAALAQPAGGAPAAGVVEVDGAAGQDIVIRVKVTAEPAKPEPTVDDGQSALAESEAAQP